MASQSIFTVDWEDWFNALYPPNQWIYKDSLIAEPTLWLLNKLKENKIKAIFYVLGHTKEFHPVLFQKIKEAGHVIGSHGYWHGHNESEPGLFRSPYWDTTPMPGWSGGFFFRALPYKYLVRNIKKSGVFWLHPHDILLKHPRVENPFFDFKRRFGLKYARYKLMRIMKDVNWRDPSSS